MAKMSFEDYVEDMMDMCISLMSDQQIASAKKDYATFIAKKPAKKEPQHPDMAMRLEDLRARCARLVASQKISVSRTTDEDAAAAGHRAIEMGEALLAKRATKAELIEHAQANSGASRLMNLAAQKSHA